MIRTLASRHVQGVAHERREEHFHRAVSPFGDCDFDRLSVVHAIEPGVFAEVAPAVSQWRIYWTTVPQIVRDLLYSRPADDAAYNTRSGPLSPLPAKT
jgi:hypothetical protein